MSNTVHKLAFKEKFAYGFGDLASVLYWQTHALLYLLLHRRIPDPCCCGATMFW